MNMTDNDLKGANEKLTTNHFNAGKGGAQYVVLLGGPVLEVTLPEDRYKCQIPATGWDPDKLVVWALVAYNTVLGAYNDGYNAAVEQVRARLKVEMPYFGSTDDGKDINTLHLPVWPREEPPER